MRKALWILTVLLLVSGVIYLQRVYKGYQKGRDEYEHLQREYVHVKYEDHPGKVDETENETGEPEPQLPQDAPEQKVIDFMELQETNSDVIAWIDLPAVEISYPVVQAKDNEYYLHRGINKEYLFAGSIFMDAYNNPNFINMNTIIYGHNMRDKSMFGKLDELKNTEVVSKIPYFWIYTPNASYLYKIFSVHGATNGSSTFTVRFKDAGSYESWLARMTGASCVAFDDIPDSDDLVVTLSTCTASDVEKCVVQGYCIAILQ